MARSHSCAKNIVRWAVPAGGDGGRGGSVIFEVNEGMSTLLDFKYQPRLIARDGEGGRGKQQYGKAASDLVVRVPPGTIAIDDESGEVLADMVLPGERKTIAQGGEGGKGNIHFATSTRRSPRIATPGLRASSAGCAWNCASSPRSASSVFPTPENPRSCARSPRHGRKSRPTPSPLSRRISAA